MISPASVPVIDLRLLSHSEIADLARNDPHAYDLNRLSVVVPKIDRSTFNESAGSRKQTYSRIRKPSPAPRRPSPDRGDLENELIVQYLQHLFEPDKYPRPPDTDPITPPSDRIPPQPRSDQNPVLALAAPPPPPPPSLPPPTGRTATTAAAVTVAEMSRALVVVEDNKDKEVLNEKGEVVDVAGLGLREEPFADELKRRTEGMNTEEELLRFLAGLDGKWGSSRKKRKFVDAAGLGDVFPRGWKVLLGLRRKEGVPSLYCRRYISPNGREFVTCKEVASYMVSLVGHQDVKQQASGQDDNGSSGLDKSTTRCDVGSSQGDVTKDKPNYLAVMPISTVSADQEKPSAVFNVLECHKCSLTFGDKETLVQHIFSFHQNDSKRKRRRLGTSVGHGVIVKDGKYICQFCHKSFSERRSYNGHVGSHVRNPGSSAEAFSHKSSMRTITNQAPFAAVPISQIDVLANKKEGTSTSKSIAMHVGSSTSRLETDSHETIQNAKNATHDIAQVAYTSKPSDDSIQDSTKSIVETSCVKFAECAVTTSCVKFAECAVTAPPPIDTHSVSPSSHDIPRGDTLIDPVHDQINDIDLDGIESVENVGSDSVKVIKPDECSKVVSPLPPNAGNCAISVTQICSHDISQGDTLIKHVHGQISDIDMDGHRSVESVSINSSMVKKSDGCSNIISPLLPSSGGGSGSQNCLHGISREDTLIKPVHNQINDIDMDGYQSTENVGNDSVKVIKPDECSKIASPLPLAANTSLETVTTSISKPMDMQTIEFDMKGSRSEVIVEHDSVRDLETNKSLSTFSTSFTKTNNAACGNGIDLSSISISVGGAGECDIIDYKSSEMVDTSNSTDMEPNSSLDALAPSLINLDSMTCASNEVKRSVCTLVSGIEKYSMEQRGESGSGLISTTDNETGSYINNISPSLANLGSMSGEASTDMNLSTRIMFPRTEKYKEQMVDSFVGSTSSKCHSPVGSGHPGLFIGTPDCTFYSDMKPVSVLEETNNELENFLDTSKTEDVGDAAVTDGRNSLHSNMAQTSWLHSDDSFHIDFIPEQIEDGPNGAGQEQGNITGYEDLRMDVEPPMEFDFMTGHASAPLMEFDFMTYQGSLPSSQHGMSYVAQMEDVNHPSLELDWRLSLPDVVDGGCEFKQCVWCGREFYHESLSSQLQPNMIGLICPACKENT